jgi:hypothetical protein
MANVSFNRGDNTKMDNTPITDGLIFINTEEEEIFFDNNDTRISIGGSGGGHVIQNPAGTNMAQEPNMQFKDARITDDSTNKKTVVEVVDEKTLAQFNDLPLTGSADGFYVIGDGQGGSGINASEINYDNTDSGMTATDVQDAIDELNADKVGEWELVGTASGTNSVAIDATTVKEICVVWAWNAIGFSTILPSVFLNNKGAINQIRNGYYQSAGANEGSTISVSPTSISIIDFFVNGANKVSEATLKVYKR